MMSTTKGMKKMTPNRHLAAIAAALALTVAGCSGGEEEPRPSPTLPPAPPTVTEDPAEREARKAAAAEEVIANYLAVDHEHLDSDGYISIPDAQPVAVVEYINERNIALGALRRGGRTLTIESTVVDHQVLAYTEDEPASERDGLPVWYIEIRMCGEASLDYRESDGTVIDSPDNIIQGAERVWAQWDSQSDTWILQGSEPAVDAADCDFGADSGAEATTGAP